MKGKEGTGDPGGPDAKSGCYSSGSGLCPSGEKPFFADGLFKHMRHWIQRFLKKYARQQAFDDAWKSLPPYPGFFVPKKVYREVTQWQGKEMRNLGRCVLRVLAVALRQLDSTQVQPFSRALT